MTSIQRQSSGALTRGSGGQLLRNPIGADPDCCCTGCNCDDGRCESCRAGTSPATFGVAVSGVRLATWNGLATSTDPPFPPAPFCFNCPVLGGNSFGLIVIASYVNHSECYALRPSSCSWTLLETGSVGAIFPYSSGACTGPLSGAFFALRRELTKSATQWRYRIFHGGVGVTINYFDGTIDLADPVVDCCRPLIFSNSLVGGTCGVVGGTMTANAGQGGSAAVTPCCA